MKRIKYYFLVFIFFVGILIGNIINAFAKSEVNYYEEINPIRDSIGNIIGEEVIITLPKGFNKELIRIDSSLFDGYYHYSNDDREFIVKITVNNKSKYDYKYINNTLNISPKNTFNSYNYINYGVNDGIIINDSYYRSYNAALRELIPIGSELNDEVIDLYLRNYGYSGIDELNKYYDDYYGKWYSFGLLLEGDVSSYKESNSILVSDAYKYFYSNILSFSCNDNKFGVLKYRGQCNNIFSVFNKNSKFTISNMKIYRDNNDYFNNYLMSVGFQFELFRV